MGRLYNNLSMKSLAFDVIRSMFPDDTLPEDLINKPETLKILSDAKREADEAVEAARLKIKSALAFA